MAGSLTVSFAGQDRLVEDRLTFGRTGELELDSNPHLHRIVGEFARRDDAWWLRNLGTRLFLTLTAPNGTRVDLAPGGQHLLATNIGSVRISVGQARDELSYRLDHAASPEFTSQLPGGDGSTTDFRAFLTPREIDFLVTFARPVLDGTNEPLPTYADVASVWGVSPKTLDNTLQSIKRKMRNARLARDEPLDTLVRIAIAHSLVTKADLDWSDLILGGARSAATGPRFSPS